MNLFVELPHRKTKMPKEYKFKCWNCGKKFSQSRKITDDSKFIVVCTHCKAEAVVDISPYKRPLEIYKGLGPNAVEILELPDLIPTQKPTK